MLSSSSQAVHVPWSGWASALERLQGEAHFPICADAGGHSTTIFAIHLVISRCFGIEAEVIPLTYDAQCCNLQMTDFFNVLYGGTHFYFGPPPQANATSRISNDASSTQEERGPRSLHASSSHRTTRNEPTSGTLVWSTCVYNEFSPS